MKKILTFVLACVMLTSVFAANVFAAEIVPGSNTGVQDFDDTDVGGNVTVTVATITHNYAVDIMYDNTTLTLPGVVWNVSTHTYDAANGDTFNNTDVTFRITNHSDLPITTSIAVVDNNANDAITFTWKATTGDVTAVSGTGSTDTAFATINAVVAGGNATVANYALDVECTDFFKAADTYKNAAGDALIAATYTVTVTE